MAVLYNVYLIVVVSIKAKHHRWFGTAFWLNVRSSLSRVAREVKSTLVPITNGSIFLDVARICQALTVKDLCKEFVEIVDCMISCAMSLDCWIDWKRNFDDLQQKQNTLFVLHWLTWRSIIAYLANDPSRPKWLWC